MRRTHFSRILAVFSLACTALMVACGSETYYADDYRNHDRDFGFDSEETTVSEPEVWNDTLIALEGNFRLASFLEPVQLDFYSLDEKLERQKSVSARIARNRLDFSYKAKELLFGTPTAELELVCRFRDSKDTTEMRFHAYMKLSDKGARDIALYPLLESDYLKKLVQKEREPFNLARKHAHQAIHDMLDPEQDFEYDIRNAPYGNDTLETFTYLYCLFFLEDTTFYSSFRKIASAIGSDKKWDDILSPKKIADGLIEHYRLGESQCDTIVLAEVKKDIDFTQLRYNMAIRIVGDTSTCATYTATPRDSGDINDTSANDPLHEMTPAEKFGECTINRQNQKVMLDTGKYYQCKDGEWIPTIAPVYYNLWGDEGDYVTYDGDYFHCSGKYSWDKVDPEDVLPPVKDLRKCNKNEIVQYGDKFYKCDRIWARWTEVPDDNVALYKKNGFFCTDSTEGRIEQDNGRYWTCQEFRWGIISFIDSVVYSYNLDHRDECRNGPKGTTVHWNEAISKKYSTQVYLVCDGSTLEWEEVGIAERDNYEEATFDGAVFVDDSTFRATSGNFTYTVRKRAGWAGIFDVIGIEAEIGGKEYGAFFRNKVPYLSGKRGDKDIVADTFPGKSENFDSFVAPYMHPESAYPAFNITLTRAGENSYMDWEQAAEFCPEGYHVPDTTEWPENILTYFPLERSDAQDSPMQVYYNGKRKLYDIYWTSASKDSETHYCYEIRSEGDMGLANRIIECPDNLYPGVQTLCFKDGE